MKKYYPIIIALLFSGNIKAFEYEPDLCNENEHVLFSCAIGEKVVSVCSAKLSYPDYWYLSYRFGSFDNKPELEYAATAKEFPEKFEFRLSGYSKGETKELSFSIGSYTYTLHEDGHVYRDDSAGVFVSKNGDQLKYFACNNPDPKYKGESLYLLEKEGFPTKEATHIGTKGP